MLFCETCALVLLTVLRVYFRRLIVQSGGSMKKKQLVKGSGQGM
jgi:hypothetical protein